MNARFLILLFLPIIVLMSSSCDGEDTRFRIEGRFKNMNQADLFLVNLQEGTKDTLHVLDGRFAFETNLTDTAIMVVVFPNFSELPIVAEPGNDVTIDGDASHLKETTVEGTDNNDLLTAFRLKTSDMMPPEVISEAEDYIRRHPATPVASYLLRRYFLTTVDADYGKAFELATLIREAQPSRVAVGVLHHQLEALKNAQISGRLADFTATDTHGNEVSNKMLTSDVNVICLWASWNFDSQSMLRHLGILQKIHPGRISVISISVDTSPEEGQSYLQRDSLKNPNICDGGQWESPVIRTLGMAYVPDNIVVDREGNILARSLSSVKLREKIEELLGEQQ